MKKNIAVLILCLYIPTILCISDEMKELAAQLRSTCVAETGVDAALIDKVNSDKIFPEDEKFKCYIKCLLVQMACIDDNGNVDVEATIAVLPEEFREVAEPIVRSCGPKKGANACESAWLTHKCYLETNPSAYFLV